MASSSHGLQGPPATGEKYQVPKHSPTPFLPSCLHTSCLHLSFVLVHAEGCRKPWASDMFWWVKHWPMGGKNVGNESSKTIWPFFSLCSFGHNGSLTFTFTSLLFILHATARMLHLTWDLVKASSFYQYKAPNLYRALICSHLSLASLGALPPELFLPHHEL